jgi:hypothetical protein
MGLDEISWQQVYQDLDAESNATIKGILSPDECDEIRVLYNNEDLFRSQVVMSAMASDVVSIAISAIHCPI